MASFNFKGSDQQKKVGVLSGGERNRVHLAKVLRSGANVLLLDEPTNDLDVDTLRALEAGLEDYAGCAVVISHDRWFLDRVATHILAFEGDSQVRWFEGNFSDYETYRRKELGQSDQPHPDQVQAPHPLTGPTARLFLGLAEGLLGGGVAVLVEVLDAVPAVVDVHVADHLAATPFAGPELDDLGAQRALGPVARFDESHHCTTVPGLRLLCRR